MLKKVLLAAVAASLVTAVSLPLQITPASAAMTCKAAAKMKYPNNFKQRHAWKKACKARWKALQKA
jgi:hypothetical protein